MSSKHEYGRKILPLRQRPHEFLTLVHGLAADTQNIAWSRHARERFEQRGITIRMALDVLRSGRISGEIVAGNKAGEWKAKIVNLVPGRREVGVVAILVKESRVFVKTVEWED